MSIPKTEAEMKAAADHAYAAIEKAIDQIRAECDYGWIRRKLWGGYRICPADAPTGPDAAWTFDCPLEIDCQPSALAVSVPCMGKAVLVADGEEVGADPMQWYPVVRAHMRPGEEGA